MKNNSYSSFPLEIKTFESNGIISGYASVFSVNDHHNDQIQYGAFKESIIKHHQSSSIKLLWQHKPEEPIGVFNLLAEDHYGLYIEAKLLLEVQRAKEAYNLLKAGAINGLSIGYTPIEYEFDNEKRSRILTKINLWEISLVTFPANEQAYVTNLKHTLPKRSQSVCSELKRINNLLKDSIALLRN